MGYLAENGIKAVAFDIDGTFYPLKETNRRVLRASVPHLPFALRYNKARQTVRTEDCLLDLPPLTREEIAGRMAALVYGEDTEENRTRFLRKEKKVFTDKYEKYFLSIKPYEGVKELLEALKKKGCRLGVLSDFPIGTKLKAMGVEDYFPVRISSEDFGRYKPCCTPFRLLSQALGVPPQEILYVGDSERKDIEGAARMGFHTVLLSTKKASSSADLTVSSWKELKERIL